MPATPPTRRRRLQFGVGTMLVVVTVAALVACWLTWRYQDVFAHDFYLYVRQCCGLYSVHKTELRQHLISHTAFLAQAVGHARRQPG
jgi:hypothetical protein